MEFLVWFNYNITYVKGKMNLVADALCGRSYPATNVFI